MKGHHYTRHVSNFCPLNGGFVLIEFKPDYPDAGEFVTISPAELTSILDICCTRYELIDTSPDPEQRPGDDAGFSDHSSHPNPPGNTGDDLLKK